ncbi:MAG: HEAT repeat domain-containing protein [Myxococcota bacterium]
MVGSLRIEHIELALDPDTPVYLDVDRADAAVFAALDTIVAAGDDLLGARAVTLCGHAKHPAALEVVARGCLSASARLREAAAAALGHRRDDPPQLLAMLLLDRNSRVRTRALRVLARRPVHRRLRHLKHVRRLRADPDPAVRRVAGTIGLLRARRRTVLLTQRTM